MCFKIVFVIHLFLTFNRIIARNDLTLITSKTTSHKLLSHDLSERSIECDSNTGLCEGMSLPSLSIIITYSRIIIFKNAFK